MIISNGMSAPIVCSMNLMKVRMHKILTDYAHLLLEDRSLNTVDSIYVQTIQ